MTNSKHVLDTKTLIPPLPPSSNFTLSYILSQVPTNLTQSISDSILNINSLYSSDLAEQLTSLSQVESEEILLRLETVQRAYIKLGKIRSEEAILRKEKYKKINSNLDVALNEVANSKNRVNTLLLKLKKVETKLDNKDCLFNLRSPHKTHYGVLFEYGMKGNEKNEKNGKNQNNQSHRNCQMNIPIIDLPDEVVQNEESPINDDLLTKNVKNLKPLPVGELTENRKHRNSNSTTSSALSKQKLDQYLTLEMQLDELQKNHPFNTNSKFSNPIDLLRKEEPTCEISTEHATIRSTDIIEPSQVINDQSSQVLVEELKRLFDND